MPVPQALRVGAVVVARQTRSHDFPDAWKISAVSLGDELESIISALEAVDVLLGIPSVGGSEEASRHSRLVAALVMLAQRRLRTLRQVAIGELEVTALIDRYNSRSEPEPHEDDDVLLKSRAK